MKARNLSEVLKNEQKGWVAINEKNEIVVKATSLNLIFEKVKTIKEDLTIIPAAKDYSGLIN